MLASASGIARPTLYNLLNTLTERGELIKRDLPGGGSGYALAASAAGDTARATAAGDVAAVASEAQRSRPDGAEGR